MNNRHKKINMYVNVSMCRLRKAGTVKVGKVPDIGTTAIMWN